MPTNPLSPETPIIASPSRGADDELEEALDAYDILWASEPEYSDYGQMTRPGFIEKHEKWEADLEAARLRIESLFSHIREERDRAYHTISGLEQDIERYESGEL